MRHAVIMAGGSGTRLWPLSRKSHPKQLLRLFEGESLLRKAFERLRGPFDPKQIYVITSRDYIPAVSEELPELPPENLIGEPCARDTANAVGLAAHLLALKDPGGTMGIFTADHIITPIERFQSVVLQGFEAAEKNPNALITFGVRPTSPHTGYGYIHRGQQLSPGVYEIRRFREKPDVAMARRYIASGEYYWNSGMFVWRLSAILDQFHTKQPETAEVLGRVAAEFHDQGRQAHVLEQFSALPRISVDFAIMERADRVLAVELPCDWLDVGSWTSLAEVIPPDEAGNTPAAPAIETLDASNNIFVSETEHLIAAIGVSDLVVVHSEDVTLVCRKQDAQRIKELVEIVRQRRRGYE